MKALVQMGDAAVPAIKRGLPLVQYDQAFYLLRVLRLIGGPRANDAFSSYKEFLRGEIKTVELIQGMPRPK